MWILEGWTQVLTLARQTDTLLTGLSSPASHVFNDRNNSNYLMKLLWCQNDNSYILGQFLVVTAAVVRLFIVIITVRQDIKVFMFCLGRISLWLNTYVPNHIFDCRHADVYGSKVKNKHIRGGPRTGRVGRGLGRKNISMIFFKVFFFWAVFLFFLYPFLFY